MKNTEVGISFFNSLQSLYDTDPFASLTEFCQGENRVLMYLNLNDYKDIYPSDLSEALYVTRQRITSILSSLRKKGYVSLEHAENDRRRVYIKLTSDGKNYITERQNEAENYLDCFIESFGEENVSEFTRMINLTIEKMQDYTNKSDNKNVKHLSNFKKP